MVTPGSRGLCSQAYLRRLCSLFGDYIPSTFITFERWLSALFLQNSLYLFNRIFSDKGFPRFTVLQFRENNAFKNGRELCSLNFCAYNIAKYWFAVRLYWLSRENTVLKILSQLLLFPCRDTLQWLSHSSSVRQFLIDEKEDFPGCFKRVREEGRRVNMFYR